MSQDYNQDPPFAGAPQGWHLCAWALEEEQKVEQKGAQGARLWEQVDAAYSSLKSLLRTRSCSVQDPLETHRLLVLLGQEVLLPPPRQLSCARSLALE